MGLHQVQPWLTVEAGVKTVFLLTRSDVNWQTSSLSLYT